MSENKVLRRLCNLVNGNERFANSVFWTGIIISLLAFIGGIYELSQVLHR